MLSSNFVINGTKLPSPVNIVKKLSQIKSIIVWTIIFEMTSRRQSCHFMPVDGISAEKMFYFVGDLRKVC